MSATAYDTIAAIETRAEQLAEIVRTIQQNEDDRSAFKTTAIRRLIGTDNPETGKPHSATSAEKAIESDPEYRGFREVAGRLEAEKHLAFGRYEAAKLRARLEVALIEAGVTV